ncbi:MAG: DUF3347 domain-containing protein [Ignavibacteria bacterium]|nr:DUF3347 domain-containing protein [Ignavibacteria bacterium]
MKTTVIMLFLALVSWGASAQHDHSGSGHSGSSHSKMAPKMKEEPRVIPTIKVKHSLSVTSILDNYLALKDALVDDNGKKAASSGKMLFDAIGKFDFSSQDASKQKELKEILDNAKENAEHISENGDKIDHQREHFEVLGGDLKDLIVITGSDRNLHQLFCPMYNSNKGGKWLSASDKIKNPFYGSKMLKCGRVLVEITTK